MTLRKSAALGLLTLLAVFSAAGPALGLEKEERVIAGSAQDSLEVRHLVLRGTNEEIGRALAEIAKERYGTGIDPAGDPLQVRAQRKFLERNYPILLERLRGVLAAFGKSIDEDAWDLSGLGFTDLHAGCSVAHLPRVATANGKSVVSRDYDYSTGNLMFGFLPPGMLHPTARPYLVEMHPDRGYASIAMVAYDLLSGVLDGINSEGLTVTLAMDDDLRMAGAEPVLEPGVGLGELQTLRMLLDTCATVEDAKEALRATKQYYQFVPVHYLIADRNGDAFIWAYSGQHNKELIIETPGEPLVMTNFSFYKHLANGKPPSAEEARNDKVCPRYAFLRDKLSAQGLDDQQIRAFHEKVDAQAAPAANPNRPPIRTFWHAFYYPEDRKVRVSYYLKDEPIPGDDRHIRPVRSDYLEFRLEPTESGPGTGATAAEPATQAASPPPASSTSSYAQAAIEAAGGSVKRDGKRIVGVGLSKVTKLETVLPLLPQLTELEELTLANPAFTDADARALQGLPKLRSLGLMGAPIGDDGLEALKKLPALRILNISDTKVTDAGLAHLSDLTALEYLCLKGVAIGDAGLAHLERLTGLNQLILADTQVTDAGLVHLAGMKRLESINLSNTAVTDAGLAQLGVLSGIAGLNLTGTKVTDAGLEHLKAFPKLTKLNVTGTPVTEDGLKQAKKFLPFWAKVTR